MGIFRAKIRVGRSIGGRGAQTWRAPPGRADVYYATFLLLTRVGPPSAKFCRTVANFPQVDVLRFINF